MASVTDIDSSKCTENSGMKWASGKTATELPESGLITLPIDHVHENPRNERKTFTAMEPLIESIKMKNIIEPPAAIPHPTLTGHVELVTGNRRFRAAKQLGHKAFTVNIGPPEDAHSLRITNIISNIQREDVPTLEMAEGLQAILDESDSIKTQRDLAKWMGKDECWVSGMLRILTMSERNREKLRSTQVSVGCDSAVRIARLDDQDTQAELIDAAAKGATEREVRRRIAQIESKRKVKNHPQQLVTERLQSIEVVKNGAKAMVQSNVGPQARKNMLAAIDTLRSRVLRLMN